MSDRPLRWERALLGVALLLTAIPSAAHAGRDDREAAALAGLPDQFAGAAPDGAVSDAVWWQGFQVGELDQIVGAGLEANPDLMTAQRQLAQARAIAASGLAPLLPSVSLNTSISGQPVEAQTFFFDFPGETPTGNVWTGNALVGTVSWGLDLWGANLLSFLAGRQDALASAESAAAQRLTISTSVASTWFDVVFHSSRVRTIESQVALTENVLELTELRYERGEATALDVLQQRQQAQATRALLPQSRSLLRISQMQLAVLLGRSPDRPPEVLTAQMPELPPPPSVGTPDELMGRAPGVRAATAQLDAAEYRQRAALRATLPQVSLTYSYGPKYRYEAEGLLWEDFDEDGKIGSFWSAGAQATWPIFNGGSAFYTYRAAVEGAEAARYSLESAALAAVQQVEGALVLEEERALQREAVAAQLEAARQAFEAARERYQTGQTTFLPVLTAQQTLLQAELSALQAHRDQLDARIQLYAALGAATHASGSAQ